MKVMKSKTASGHVYVPNRAARVASAKSNEQWHATARSTPRPEAFAPSSDSTQGSSDVPEAGVYAIFHFLTQWSFHIPFICLI